MKPLSRAGLTLAGAYLLMFALSGVYALYRLTFHTATSEFCGLPAILVTMPTSLVLFRLERALGILGWYDRLSGVPWIYGLCAMLTLAPAALINAAAFYWLGRTLSER